jgi:hypothetical protein
MGYNSNEVWKRAAVLKTWDIDFEVLASDFEYECSEYGQVPDTKDFNDNTGSSKEV